MNYLSVCSGIEATSVAWMPIGWTPVAFSEIEPFACSLLAHHYPEVPNMGDITCIDGRQFLNSVDILVGGTPCQGFSIAGKRGGLQDARSGLARHFVRLIRECRPRLFLWENVCGALSTHGGRDFGTLIRALAECGYCVGWRVFDAQFFGVPQRRRRVFVIGHSGSGRAVAEILFERQGLCGTAAARRETRAVAPCLTRRGAFALDDRTLFVLEQCGPRRATPLEWERLMGFPDAYTDVKHRGKPASDSCRYQALGNSMAVPVLRWLGQRIHCFL